MKKQLINTIIIIIIILSTTENASAQCVQCDANSSATGNYSSAMGMTAVAQGQASLAAGLEANSVGNYSMALGKFVTSEGASSLTLGRYLKTTSSPSMIIGTGWSTTNMLENNISNSLMIGFSSDKPTFFVKGSSGIGTTGKIGIGDVTNPMAKLHIKADAGENTDLMLEPGSFNLRGRLLFGGETNSIQARATADMFFFTGSNFIFTDGNVGINNYNPTEKLDVNGNIKTTGFILDNGAQAANKVLQSDANGLATWVDPMALSVDDGDWVTAAFSDNIYRLDGNVGIGTTNPLSRFEVTDSYGKVEFNNDQLNINSLYSGYSPSLKLTNSNGNFWQIKNDYSASDFEIYNNTSKLFSITANGDVMIGNNSRCGWHIKSKREYKC